MEHHAPHAGRFMAGRDYTIAEATKIDVDELTAIMTAATEYDILYRFFFSHNRDECVDQMRAAYRDQSLWMMSELGQEDWSRFVKAVDADSGKILGWGLVRSAQPVDALDEKEIDEPPLRPDIDPWQESCLQFYQRKLEWRCRQVITGKGRYFVWQALYILPTYQRKGIGTALVRWAFDAYDLSRQDMYLQTAYSMMPFYQKLGWRNVGATEVDLAHWGGEGMGFGVHRTVHMLRVPLVKS